MVLRWALRTLVTTMAAEQPLSQIRRSYKAVWNVLLEEDLPTRNPVKLFHLWFTEAKESGTTYEANAVAVASATRDGIPSMRMVLLKEYDERGFVFFTNYDSRKGRELLSNPRASMLFYWDHLHRQIRIEGRIDKISRVESEAYFQTRPRDSQISACISKQSTAVASRKVLEEEHAALKKKYADTSIPVKCPDNWGGLILIPERFEFWQGQSTRLHDRLIFRKPTSERETDLANHGWYLERLAP